MNVYIVTGTSRGIGEAFVDQLLEKNNLIYCLSRTKNKALIQKAEEQSLSLVYHECDLDHVLQLEAVMQEIFDHLSTMANVDQIDSLVLLNNAGMVQPVKPIQYIQAKDITQHFHVNLIAPSILTAMFIKLAASYALATQTIINISSGAGKHPYESWSQYCSAKAGIDMLTRCVAAEQELNENPVKVISFAPGVVDTQMQAEIRGTKKEDFVHVDRFLDLKRDGKLLTASQVAQTLSSIVQGIHEIDNGAILDIREINS